MLQKKNIAEDILNSKKSYSFLAKKYKTSKSTIGRIAKNSKLYLKASEKNQSIRLPYITPRDKLNEEILKKFNKLRDKGNFTIFYLKL